MVGLSVFDVAVEIVVEVVEDGDDDDADADFDGVRDTPIV